ncbi:MAG: hypothetical protein ACRCUB_12750 [Plesiomonas shigelloides]
MAPRTKKPPFTGSAKFTTDKMSMETSGSVIGIINFMFGCLPVDMQAGVLKMLNAEHEKKLAKSQTSAEE